MRNVFVNDRNTNIAFYIAVSKKTQGFCEGLTGMG